MMLNPEELEVTSFETAAAESAAVPTVDNPNDPTPMTFCYWCPGETYNCG